MERSCLTAPGALYSVGDGQVDPYRLTHCALRSAQSKGLRAFANTSVDAIRDDLQPGTTILETAHGRIIAQQIVFATGYVSHQYTQQDVGTLHSTYAAVSEPVPAFCGWPDQCLIWETARPYFYARQTDDGRAMIGGEDTPFFDDHAQEQMLEGQTARLQARFRELFPQIDFKPAYAWAGTFGETKDGLAYIGNAPGSESRYFALGYGGNGITFSVIAARLITDLIVKRPNNDAAVFRFGR
jgi:glycine/D-amino acid oxidase-like deaminating enzyme